MRYGIRLANAPLWGKRRLIMEDCCPNSAGAHDTWTSIDLPEGLTWEVLAEAVDLIVDWREDELDEDPVRLAIRVFEVYSRGHGSK